MLTPITYRGIKRLAKQTGVTLFPGCAGPHYPRACIITMMGIANGMKDFLYCGMSDYLDSLPNDMKMKLKSLEYGFENCQSVNCSGKYMRYYNIGQRLRAECKNG